MENDSLLVSCVVKGDTDSFAVLVSRYRDRLFNFIYKMTLSREDTEDILQEVFIRVYNNLYKYDGKRCFSTWIFSIALNVFKSEYAKKKKAHSVNYREILEELPGSPAEDPEAAYETKERSLEILKILDNLNFDQKALLVLKHIQGFSYREVAEILKISPENARIKVMRARQTLFKKFNELKEAR